jgi:hypothetical protein
MLVVLDHGTFELSLSDVSAAAAVLVKALGVGDEQALHQAAELCYSGLTKR